MSILKLTCLEGREWKINDVRLSLMIIKCTERDVIANIEVAKILYIVIVYSFMKDTKLTAIFDPGGMHDSTPLNLDCNQSVPECQCK